MAALFARVLSLITIDLAKWLFGIISQTIEAWRAKRADEAKNAQIRKQNEEAKTREERENALKNELRNS